MERTLIRITLLIDQRDMVQLPNGRVYDEYYVFLVLHGLM